MNARRASRAYPVTLVLSVGVLVLIGAMAISMLVTGDPAYPVKVFGLANANDRVGEAALIRPGTGEMLPQTRLQSLQLLPLPAPIAAAISGGDVDGTASADSLYQAAARAGTQQLLDRARMAARAGDRALANRLYEQLQGSSIPPRLLVRERASVLASFGDHVGALAVLRRALPAFPADAELHLLAAHNAWWAERPLVADSLVGRALALAPTHPDALRLRATIRSTTQPPLAVAQRWARESPGTREQLVLARALVREEQYGSSLAAYRSVARDPALATDSLLLEAASAAAAADSLAALEHFTERYLVAHPDDDEALLRLARAYGWRGEYDTALRHYARVRRTDPAFRFEVAQALVWSRREDEASRQLAQVVADDPANAEAWKLRGDLAAWSGRWDEAARMYAEASRVAPGTPGLAEAIATAEAGREQARLASLPRLPGDDYGASIEAFGDNQGFRWFVTRASRGFTAGALSLRATAGHNVMESGVAPMRSRNPGLSGRLDAAWLRNGRMRLDATAGVETYAGIRSFPVLGLGVTVYDVFDMQVTADVRHGPAAYRVASLAALQARATSTVLGLGASIARGRWAAWTRAESEQIATMLGSARRTSATGSVQRALTSRVSATANVVALAYDREAPVVPGFGNAFWAPRYYVEPSVGLMYRAPLGNGLSAGVGATGGYGFVEERGDRRFDRRSVPTAGLSADLTYRRGRWDVMVEGRTGGALSGGYRSGMMRLQASYRFGQ